MELGNDLRYARRQLRRSPAFAATLEYFHAMGIPLKQSRLFNVDDSADAPLAAVVNEAFTRQIDGAGLPLGMRVDAAEAGPHKYATIVGVVADARQGMRLVVRRAIVLLCVGSALGIATSLGLSRVASSLLAGVDTHNILLVIEAVTAILAITCITASYLPARRAAQTDPIEALRHE